jgi:hypothetical protein
VKRLHGFIREVALTQDEWRTAIDFSRRPAKNDDERQEFILLSDTLDVSMLVQ